MDSRVVVDKSGRGLLAQSQTTPRQPRRAQQSRIVTTLRPRDLHLVRRRAKGALLNLPVHLRRKQVPTIHGPTRNHDDLRIDEVDYVRESDSQVHSKTLEHREREFITITSGLVNSLRRQSLTLQP